MHWSSNGIRVKHRLMIRLHPVENGALFRNEIFINGEPKLPQMELFEISAYLRPSFLRSIRHFETLQALAPEN